MHALACIWPLPYAYIVLTYLSSASIYLTLRIRSVPGLNSKMLDHSLSKIVDNLWD